VEDFEAVFGSGHGAGEKAVGFCGELEGCHEPTANCGT
jgi:hypothetical protein